MEIGLRLSQNLGQELKLQQVISLSHLMAVPDEVLNIVAGAISYNPDSVESILQEAREKSESDKNYPSSSKKVQTIYSSLNPSKGDSENKNGLVGTPDLRTLEGCLGDYQTVVTPDVTYIGRKNEKPELVLSDHLKGSMNLIMKIVDASKHPETAKLMSQLRSFDSWKREKLRDSYVLIGGAQREYFEDFDKQKFNVFSQDKLSEKLGLHVSTVNRILNNRWVESRNTSGEQDYMYAKDLLKTNDDLKRYKIAPLMNKIFEKEFEIEKAYSDDSIKENLGNRIARRTISKYREMSNIPGIRERNRVYKNKELNKPYNINFD